MTRGNKRPRDGTVVGELTSHQCSPGSNPSVNAMWVEFVIGFLLCSVRGSPWVLRFSPLLKTQHFQIPIRPGKVDDEDLCEWATSKIVIYSFIYLVTHLGVALIPLKRVGTWDQATPGRSG